MGQTNAEVHISLTPEEKRRIRVAAAKQDKPMTEFGREILLDWIDEHVEEPTTN